MKSINLMKNVGRFTPLPSPQSRQVRFTPNCLYDLPQIICTIYPPKITKCGSIVYELVTVASVLLSVLLNHFFFWPHLVTDRKGRREY